MRRFDQMNVIPLVDVMLVLLAIVLTTASFVAQGKIPLTLPEASHSEEASGERARVIAITADGDIHLDDEVVTLSELDAVFGRLDPEAPIHFRVDRDAAFQHFVNVLDLLRKHGLDNLAIDTETTAR
jgi:biopolymer transport protein ExbD